MNKHPMLDPDDPAGARDVQDALLESLAPVPLTPERAGAIKLRVLERVRASRQSGKDFITLRFEDGEWENLVPGVRVKRLLGETRAALFELQPGAALPFHRHHEDEECVVLRGEAQLGEVTVRAGDYHLATSGSRHGVVRSSAGALLYLRGTPIGHPLEVARDVLTALLPGRGQAPLTLHRDEGLWAEHSPGVLAKLLRDSAGSRSMLLHLEPGAAADFAAGPQGEACLVMEGEVFVGDRLMRPGDYHPAQQGLAPARLSSDVGGLLFMRGPSPGAARRAP